MANQDINTPATIVKLESGSEPLDSYITSIRIDEVETEIFSVELQTCTITEKGIECQMVRVNNVLSYLCICSQCGRGFPAKASLKLHLKIDHAGGDGNLSEFTEFETVDSMAIKNSESTSKQGKNQTTHAEESNRKHRVMMSKNTNEANTRGADKGDDPANPRNDSDDEVNNEGEGECVHTGPSHAEVKGGSGEVCRNNNAVAGNVTKAPNIESDNGSAVSTDLDIDRSEFDQADDHKYHKSIDKGEDNGYYGMCVSGDTEYMPGGNTTCPSENNTVLKSSDQETLRDTSGDRSKKQKGIKKKRSKKKLPGEKTELRPTITLPVQCCICGKRLCTQQSFVEHMNVHSGERPYKCGVCGKGYPRKSQLGDHSKIHSGQPVLRCNVCGQFCRNRSALKLHMHTHTGAKPYQCALCGKEVRRKDNLLVHMRTHTGEKPYVCGVCGRGFAQLNTLKDHSVLHDDTSFLCSHCGKTFKQRTVLTAHVRVEHGGKPQTCTTCGKVFKEKSYLRKHQMSHSKQHKCSVCGKSYSKRYVLMRHMRNLHQMTISCETIETSIVAKSESETTFTPVGMWNSTVVNLTEDLTSAVERSSWVQVGI